MVIINIFISSFILYKVRINKAAFIFYLLFFIFLYSRYVIAYFSDSYSLGYREWVFGGVGSDVVELYSYLFLLVNLGFLCACLLPLKISAMSFHNYEFRKYSVFGSVNFAKYFYFTLLFFSFIVCFLIAVQYVQFFMGGGYSADYRRNLFYSLFGFSFLYILLVFNIFLNFSSGANYKGYWVLFFYIFLFSILFFSTGQRLLVLKLLMVFFFFSKLRVFSFKAFFLFLILLLVFMLVFILREGGDYYFDNLMFDILWSLGISVNPAYLVLDNISDFTFFDSAFFVSTYYYCGIGRLFTDVCFSPDRLEYPGFFLEKIADYLYFDSFTPFGGIGGNLIASFFVLVNWAGPLSWLGLFLISFVFFEFVLFLLSCKMGVFSILVVSSFVFMSRYHFDVLIPAFNQLFLFILLRFLIFKKI